MRNVLKSQVKHLLSSVAVPLLLASSVTMLIAAVLLGAGPTGAQTPPPDRTATLPPVPVPGNGTRLFPETGKTMTGIFLDYWNTHGGLAQQGYPISDVIAEVSDLDGKLYTMQYTERAVFEYHPENPKLYNVLLSQLGTFQYKKKYPNGAASQKPNNSPGSVLFKETGKRLGGRFLQYWQQNGGLMQQGFPITDEFTEVSDLNGKPYTVQYFERAVFEYHPENRGTQYEVLLSQLGTYRWRGRYEQQPSPIRTVGPTASPTTPLATGVRDRAVANNRYLFWIDDNPPTYSVRGYDWEQKSIFLVTNRPGRKFSLATDDKTLVWGEGDVEGTAGIRGYNILNPSEFVAVQPQSPSPISEDTMVIDEAMLYYVGNLSGRYGIIARNISTGQADMAVEGGRNPVIRGDTMVWSKEVATCGGGNRPPCTFVQELHVRKANNDRLISRVSGETAFWEYDVWGDHVVWIAPNLIPEGNPPNAYRISTGITNVLSNLTGSHPVINDNLVSWASLGDGAGGTWSLKLHNLSTGQTADLSPRTGAYTEAQAFIGQRAVAYTVGGERYRLAGKGDLYVMDLASRP